MLKVTENLENTAKQHNSKIFYWHFNKLRGSSHSEDLPVKNKNGAFISDKKSFKGWRAEYFGNMLNSHKFMENGLKTNENISDNLKGKKNYFAGRS